MTRVAAYARVSTERQAEQYGLDAQIRGLEQRAAERSHVLLPDGERPVFADDGYSGGDLNRPALTRLREAVRAGQVDCVLCYDPDRLSRSLSDLLLLAEEVERAGVRLEFITQDIDQTPEGKLFFAVRGAVAQYEKAKIKDRMLRGKLEKARQGRVVNPGKLPVWLRVAADGQTMELDQDWTEVVRLVYHLFVDEGLTLRRIAQRLALVGQPTPSGGSQWQISTLHGWLRNSAANGELYQLTHRVVAPKRRRKPVVATVSRSPFSSAELRPREEWQLVLLPTAVDRRTWDAAQWRLDQNRALARRNGRRFYLLRGLVTCERCGRTMTGRCRVATGQRFYACQHEARVDGTGYCRSRPVPAEPIESAVWDRICGLMQRPELLKQELTRRQDLGSPTHDGSTLELRRAESRLAAIPAEMDHLVQGYGKGLVPDELMGPRIAALKAERQEVTQRVTELKSELARWEGEQGLIEGVVTFAARIASGLDALDQDGRQSLLRFLVRDIRVTEDAVVVRTILPTGPGGDDQFCSSSGGLLKMADAFDGSDLDQQVAWIQTPYHSPVFDSAGGEFATTESLLGDEDSDIFHGLAVKLHDAGRIAEISADQVARITLGGVHTSLGPEEVEGLPPYREEHWFHLGWGGLFRKRPEWEDR